MERTVAAENLEALKASEWRFKHRSGLQSERDICTYSGLVKIAGPPTDPPWHR